MNLQIIRRSALAAALMGGAALAQVTLVPTYAPNSHLFYSVAIHSAIGTRATMDTDAEVDMHVLPGATPGSFDAEMRFTRFKTTVKADSAADQAGLAQQSAATDHAAMTMAPAHFRVTPQKFTTVSRPQGPDYDQPVEMLEELARTDDLPTGPATVGNRWTRERSRALPTMNFSVALTMDCSLTAADGKTATIAVHSHGSTPLPPGSLPGSQAMAAQGLVPEATVSFDTTATSVYQATDAILQQTTSDTHNRMHIRFVGPSPQAQTTDTNIDSSATVKLERIVP